MFIGGALLNNASPQEDRFQNKLLNGTIGQLIVQVGWSSLAIGQVIDVNVEVSNVITKVQFESTLEKH
eukprot:15331490-Ditylum_brightwellii.AAC.1